MEGQVKVPGHKVRVLGQARLARGNKTQGTTLGNARFSHTGGFHPYRKGTPVLDRPGVVFYTKREKTGGNQSSILSSLGVPEFYRGEERILFPWRWFPGGVI